MLYWAFILLAVAFAAGLLGFGGYASVVAAVAQMVFFVFLLGSAILVAVDLVRKSDSDGHTD